MEDANFVEEHDSDTAALTFTDFCANLLKQCLNIAPLNVRTDWVSALCCAPNVAT